MPFDVAKSTVTFAIRNADGSVTPITGATNLPVGYVNPADHAVGSAAASINYNIGNGNSAQLQIAVVVGRYYKQTNPAYDVMISVSKPTLGAELKFLGTSLSNSPNPTQAGTLKGAAGFTTFVEGDITYNSSRTNPQGSVSAVIKSSYKPDGTVDSSTIHTYMIKTNSISTLSFVNPNTTAATATFTAKASIQDITNGTAVSVDGGALVQIKVTNGKPGLASLQVNNSKTGGIWFSSSWDGTKTVQQTAGTGQVIVQ